MTARRWLLIWILLAAAGCMPGSRLSRALESLGFPDDKASVRFAVIGDTGTGWGPQYDVAQTMYDYRNSFNYDFVLMLGDNLYGSEGTADFESKFQQPYRALLDAKVDFYAVLGNHDTSAESYFAPFNMNGKRYYAFVKGNARFFALDSNYLDTAQLTWLERELFETKQDWKIVFMHHPLYSASSYHGVDPELRLMLEPILTRYGVDVVLSGHEHFYERLRPQYGIAYFTSGAAGKLHRRGRTRSSLVEKTYDADQSFMLMEIDGDDLYYRAIARSGRVVDSGVMRRSLAPSPASQFGSSTDPRGQFIAN